MFIRKIYFLFFLSFASLSGTGQSFLWADDPGGIGNDVGAAVVTDADGNAFVTGYYSGQCDFQGTFFFSNDGFQIFLAKYNPAGTLLWVKKAGGSLSDQGIDLKIGNDGMIYLTGLFRGTATFESTTLTTNGNSDVFLAKYDPAGSLIWVKGFGGDGEDLPSRIEISNAGEILVSGTFKDKFRFNGQDHISLGYNDIFLSAWSPNGVPLWVQYYGGPNDEYVTGLLSRPGTGSLWMSGYFYYDTQIGGTSLHSAGSSDVFLAKLDSVGGTSWAIRSGGSLAEVASASAIGKGEETWLAGYFLGTAQFGTIALTDTGYNDIFLAKFDAMGQCSTAIKMGGKSLDFGTALTPGDSGDVFLSGSFEETAKFGPFVKTGIGKDIFISSISTNGTVNWVLQAGGDNEDFSKGIYRVPGGDLLLTGYFYGFCWFGPFMAAADNSGIFLSRISTLPVGRDAYKPESGLRIYPQPCQNRLFLRSEKPGSAGVYTLVDVTGNQVMKGELESGFEFKELDISCLPGGVYLLIMNFEDQILQTEKVLILH